MKKENPMKLVIQVSVYDHACKPINYAEVSLKYKGIKSDDIIKLDFNKDLGIYRAVVKPSTYLIKVSAKGLQSDKREVRVSSSNLKELFVLGKKGMPFLQRGNVKVPFESHPDLLGISVNPNATVKDEIKLTEFMQEMNLSEEDVAPMIRKDNVRVFRFKEDISERIRMNTLARISEHDIVQYAGQVVRIDKESVSFLTNDLIIKFKSSVAKEEVYNFANRFNVIVIRHIPYAGNTFQMRFLGPAVYKILDVCNKMKQTDLIKYAEPDLYSTSIDDQINPTDYLYPEQWHHDLINTPDAWQILSNINPNFTFGRPDIIVAVVDSGVDSNHNDLNGNVSSGDPKIYELFDFANMVANNNNLASDHGTGCAGGAVGMANNPSVILGQNEGTAGIAGNCRLMGIRRQGPESRYSDAYIWMAGFDSNSTLAGFPALISPGADIISNSFGYSVGLPISGLMSDTFDFLTTYGRNGKGVLLFFSVGNFLPPVDYTLWRPWAAYEKTFAIASSTLANNGITEEIATYSAFGGAGIIDLCAPSHDEYVGPRPLHNPTQNYGAVSCDQVGNGNLPGHPVTQTILSMAINAAPFTTLTANAAPGSNTLNVALVGGFTLNQWIRIGQHGDANSEWVQITAIPGGNQLTVNPLTMNHSNGSSVFGTSTITVANNTGFVANRWLLIGQPGQLNTEACLIRQVPAGGTQIIIAGPFHNHAVNTSICIGPNDYRNSFGGTSFSTPVCAGVAALMLSANPELNWVRVRQILRTTASQIDPGNADPIGQWVDTDGDGIDDYSRWYGYGRVDAQASVQEAFNLVGVGALADIDTWIMENTADVGDVPSMPPYSPDVWVRNVDPAVDNPAQVNQHQKPIRGQDNWVYFNVRNRGSIDSLNTYVRIFITRWAGTQYLYPDDFIPTNLPGTNPIQPLSPGTYLIDEIHIDSIPAGGIVTRNTIWPSALIPPANVTINGITYSWADACLLVDVSPHDGPTPTGNHTWDNNNLCQKNVFPIDPGDSDDLSIAFVVGHHRNLADLITLRVVRKNIPADVELFFDYIDIELAKKVKYLLKLDLTYRKTLQFKNQILPPRKDRPTVFDIPAAKTTFVPIPREKGTYNLVALRIKGLKRLKKIPYEIDIYQDNIQGRMEGGINFIINKMK
jgi:subtilisin family serine protease